MQYEPNMLNTILGAVAGALSAGGVAAIADRIRLGTRLTVLEALLAERTRTVKELDEKTDDHADRLKAVEFIIPELRRLIDSLHDVPGMLFTLKAMMEGDRERIRDLEDQNKD